MKNRIREFRKAAGLTQQQLGEKMGKVKSDISKLENSKAELTFTLMQSFARVFQCAPADLIATEDEKTVPLMGKVEAGNKIVSFANASFTRHHVAEYKKDAFQGEFVEKPPEGYYRDLAALRIESDSMKPFMSAGTLVYYAEQRELNLDEYLGKLCVVHLKSGETVLKILKKSMVYGRYILASYNAPNIEDVEIVWVARVVFIKPA